MNKLITTDDMNSLAEQIADIQEYSAILGRNEFLINDIYYHGGTVKGSYMVIQYLDSGISEIIEIDSNGRVYLDNNTNEYSPMYGEDLEDIAKVTKILTTWWNNLTEVKL